LNAWLPPKDATSPVVHFFLSRDGKVSKASILMTTGLRIGDDAALKAINSCQPLPAIPSQLAAPLEAVFDFHYNLQHKPKGIRLYAQP
jgi:TonB family protein